ncbi:MAG: DNA-3-methyladenine glycosylase [Elusimicrobia bacterium GWC2_51_8]|nr:MAG: DNA-3-methyladenine glycosylase [Elusimicrobia bacterium GWA2_51_34]OGR60230.1 MAG: DNA-3-methyladenine glycosylase [Elusimicrobia bacterium GWC2_51_8]OGR88674.1 MAG: DNA-3-methyladenine glycosylase [Elusimicrobia bacterium GWF2_52_66]HAF96683.1 DNA-3-methyladenine glycosylase I [Elusimicrobiota bacterium]HCE96884.1 DNA-3-methyladenine glycosylase I [Elusimicrobiota bacterium]
MKKQERCPWAYGASPLYIPYHDSDWGVQTRDDRRQFEFLTLESAQAGLSWSTILNKREGYRKAFAGFDPKKVARFNAKKIAALLKNPGIVRNRLKVNAAVNNAKRFLEVQKEFGSFSKYIWSFVGGKQKVNRWKKLSQLPATSKESDALSADLKKRGFMFVGRVIVYAHLQATGLVNDHLVTCFRHKACSANRQIVHGQRRRLRSS